jgi:hypothetical protein
MQAGISSIRRVRKMDNLRIGRACGATIVNRSDELQETDVGTGAGLFEIRKVGEEYFMFIENCKDAKSCTIILRGGSKDILNEFERNLQDAVQVARQVIFEPKLLPGGGATEMSIAVALQERARTIEGVEQYPFKAVASALEVIPRTLAQNCGCDTVRIMTELRAKKAGGANLMLGIDGHKGVLADMEELAVWDTFAVRTQVFKSAIESACLLLRIDDILSGTLHCVAVYSFPRNALKLLFCCRHEEQEVRRGTSPQASGRGGGGAGRARPRRISATSQYFWVYVRAIVEIVSVLWYIVPTEGENEFSDCIHRQGAVAQLPAPFLQYGGRLRPNLYPSSHA